jgi:phage tail sheath protein FI
MCPGITDQSVGEALIDVAERFRGLALIDSTFGLSTAQAKAERALYASSKGHALYCYGWVEVRDIDTDARKWVPRSPFRAAHIARSHDQPGSIANVGAGVDYRLRGALAIETRLDDLAQGELNELGIDVARNFGALGYGLVTWNARTISPQVLYRFLQVRVILNVIAESLEIGLLPYVFKPFDGRGRLGAEIKGSIDNLLWTFWNSDVLFGAAPREAFLVKILPNLAELEQGVVSLDVYIKPTPIAERINVTLYRVPIYYNLQTGESAIGDAELAAAA